jgi:hypothetical protein
MATGIQLVGLALITAGVMMFSVPVGLIVFGIFSTLVGVALERNSK